MADDLETFAEIRLIRDRIEDIEQTQELLVRAQGDTILDLIWREMDADTTLSQVYLQVDGTRTQGEIAAALRAAGVSGGSEPTVSRKLERLRELDLVELVAQNRSGKVYRRTRVDRILGVARRLEKRLANGAGAKAETPRDR